MWRRMSFVDNNAEKEIAYYARSLRSFINQLRRMGGRCSQSYRVA